MLVELGFIVFIVASYVYWLYAQQINTAAQSAYRLGTSAITVALAASGAYYLYKHPDQIVLLKEMLLKKQGKK